jgi:hypothetical protein
MKNKNLHFCIDYRKLADVIKKSCFSLSRIKDMLDTLTGVKWLSILDLKSSYWQVALHPDDKGKKAFSTGEGLR